MGWRRPKADIQSATTNLATAIASLENETDTLLTTLQQAIETANSAIASAKQAKTTFTEADGLASAAAYVTVENKLAELQIALGATPKVTADIESATTLLYQAVNELLKAELSLEMKQATTLRDVAVNGTPTGIYFQESIDALTAAIAAAQQKYDQTDVTLDEIGVAISVLVQAAKDFEDSALPLVD